MLVGPFGAGNDRRPVKNHERLPDGTDFTEGGEALFVEDAWAGILVEVITEGFEVGAVGCGWVGVACEEEERVRKLAVA